MNASDPPMSKTDKRIRVNIPKYHTVDKYNSFAALADEHDDFYDIPDAMDFVPNERCDQTGGKTKNRFTKNKKKTQCLAGLFVADEDGG